MRKGIGSTNCLNCGMGNIASYEKCQYCGAPKGFNPDIVNDVNTGVLDVAALNIQGHTLQEMHVIKPFIGILPKRK